MGNNQSDYGHNQYGLNYGSSESNYDQYSLKIHRLEQDSYFACYEIRKPEDTSFVRIISYGKTEVGCIIVDSNIIVRTEKIRKLAELNLSYGSAVTFATEVLKITEKVVEDYGFVSLNENMIGLNQQKRVKLWINSNFAENKPERYCANEHQTILTIIKAIDQVMKYGLLQKLQHFSVFKFKTIIGYMNSMLLALKNPVLTTRKSVVNSNSNKISRISYITPSGFLTQNRISRITYTSPSVQVETTLNTSNITQSYMKGSNQGHRPIIIHENRQVPKANQAVINSNRVVKLSNSQGRLNTIQTEAQFMVEEVHCKREQDCKSDHSAEMLKELLEI